MERFWDKVQIGNPDECWPWTASKNRDGYGTFGWYPGKTVLAHRFAWQLVRDLTHIEVGFCVLHSCDNPSCVNPNHLFLGTQKDNVEDCANKGRRNQVRFKRLSPEQRQEIRDLYATGTYTMAALGRMFGVPYQTIRYHL